MEGKRALLGPLCERRCLRLKKSYSPRPSFVVRFLLHRLPHHVRFKYHQDKVAIRERIVQALAQVGLSLAPPRRSHQGTASFVPRQIPPFLTRAWPGCRTLSLATLATFLWSRLTSSPRLVEGETQAGRRGVLMSLGAVG